MRTLALLLALAPTLAVAGEGVDTLCSRPDKKDAEVTCRTAAGETFTAVPAGHRLELTDVVLSSWAGRLSAQLGETVVWTLPLNPIASGNGARATFHTPLPVPAGARLTIPGNSGEGLFTGRLVAAP